MDDAAAPGARLLPLSSSPGVASYREWLPRGWVRGAGGYMSDSFKYLVGLVLVGGVLFYIYTQSWVEENAAPLDRVLAEERARQGR